MPRGIALNIGVNRVSPQQLTTYGGQFQELQGCVNDAEAMNEIAVRGNFQVRTLLCNEEAEADSVLSHIDQASHELDEGDIFMLTFSGHGSRRDTGGTEEADGMNDTLVLWDRQLIDDELALRWMQFRAGVRVLMISDSCHSGTVLFAFDPGRLLRRLEQRKRRKRIAPPAQQQHLRAFGSRYKQIEEAVANSLLTHPPANLLALEPRASILLLAASREDQPALDGNPHSLYTETLLNIWDNGSFGGGYTALQQQIAARISSQQQPQLKTFGALNQNFFEFDAPFTI